MNPTPPTSPAARTPIPAEVVDAFSDLAQVCRSLLEYLADPIDRAALAAAEHLLAQLAETHFPTALCSDPEDDLP